MLKTFNHDQIVKDARNRPVKRVKNGVRQAEMHVQYRFAELCIGLADQDRVSVSEDTPFAEAQPCEGIHIRGERV